MRNPERTPTPTPSSTEHNDAATAAESSPSAGWRETAAVMDTPAGLGAPECAVDGCTRVGAAVRVLSDHPDSEGDAETVRDGIRCPTHRKEFLEVSS